MLVIVFHRICICGKWHSGTDGRTNAECAPRCGIIEFVLSKQYWTYQSKFKILNWIQGLTVMENIVTVEGSQRVKVR